MGRIQLRAPAAPQCATAGGRDVPPGGAYTPLLGTSPAAAVCVEDAARGGGKFAMPRGTPPAFARAAPLLAALMALAAAAPRAARAQSWTQEAFIFAEHQPGAADQAENFTRAWSEPWGAFGLAWPATAERQHCMCIMVRHGDTRGKPETQLRTIIQPAGKERSRAAAGVLTERRNGLKGFGLGQMALLLDSTGL